jgi:hypothetical protein
MIHKTVRLLSVSLLLLALSFCDDPASRFPIAPERPRASFDGYTIDDLARYIAGRPSGLPERFAALESDPAYLGIAERMSVAWTVYTSEHLTPMRAWRAELTGKYGAEVFYPFGGPDAVHPVVLFPDARRYTLFGLERVGRLPRPVFDSPAEATAMVDAVHGGVRGILGRNFFLTLRMTGSVGATPDSGVAAILLLLLSRLEFEILDAYHIALNPEGEIVPAETEGDPDAAAYGVRVLFREAGGGTPREINYFQLNISDANIPKTPGLRAYLAGRRDMTTMLKAASYLMYLDAFDDVRGVILNRSRLVVSDSSGMPFHFLKAGDWTRTGYGDYVGPIGLFKIRYEPDRRAFYRTQPGKPLPFAYGYHPTSPNLIVAERTAAGAFGSLIFDGHDTEGVTTFFRNGRQVILGEHKVLD